MANAHLDTYRAARWRGVEYVEINCELSSGRRHDVHEYPQRNTPYTEDLGRRARTFSVEGHVVGDDHVDRAKRLQTAFEANGVGTLVTRTQGEHRAICDTFTLSFAHEQQRMTSFTAEFVEAGDLLFASVDQAITSILTGAVNDMAATFGGLLGAVAIGALSDVVSDVGDELQAVSAGRLVSNRASAELTAEARRMQSAPALYATTGQEFINTVATWIRDFADNATSPETAQQGLFLMTDWGDQYGSLPSFSADALIQETLRDRLNSYIAMLALSEAMRLAAFVDYPNRRDARLVMTSTLDTAEDVITRFETRFDDVAMRQAEKVRDQYQKVMNSIAVDLPVLACFEFKKALPALVVSHEIYGTCDRAEELIANNGYPHPLAMPTTVQALQ